MNYKINEIFYSLQGEGLHAGTAVVFIRFSDCNLNCGFCDTEFTKGIVMSIPEIIDAVKVNAHSCRRIVFTGGEPLLNDLSPLIDELNSLGFTIAVESNGTCERPAGIDWLTVSPKEEAGYAIPKASKIDELKFIINEDSKMVDVLTLQRHAQHIFLQPESEKPENIAKCVDWIEEHPNWRLSLQIHKIINIR